MSQMAPYSGDGAPSTAESVHTQKPQEKPDWNSQVVTGENVILIAGSVLLIILSFVPVWNCFILLQDSNYVFWAGCSLPRWVGILCILVILLYATMAGCFLRGGQSSVPMQQTIMTIANIYITFFGVFLMVVSLPITHQADLTYTNLMHRCESSEQTHRLFEYSQVLQNMRATPACAKMYSIEECAGYEAVAPFTTFLKGMENNFRCAGFCYRSPAGASLVSSSVEVLPAPAKLVSVKQGTRHLRTDQVSLTAEAASEKMVAKAEWSEPRYPPTLFSNQNFQASCEGMAARDMKNFAGDIGQQTFMQGIYLVLIAVATGLLKLLNFCIRKH